MSQIFSFIMSHLSQQESFDIFTKIFSGTYPLNQLEKLLCTLSDLGETTKEITGAAMAMKNAALEVPVSSEVFDVCGTGGSGTAKTFNISTTVSIILAAGGIKMAKHGNRAASSQSGSADVLEVLGINLADTPEQMAKNIEEKNIAFLFAQVLHPAMKHVMPTRKKIGKRTIFNLLGPLTNPANPSKQLVGVSDKKFLEPMITTLKAMEKKSAMVVCGEDGLDEVTLTGKTFFAKYSDVFPEIEYGEIYPEQFGFLRVSHEEISGGEATKNAQIIEEIFSGSLQGPKKDIVLLNAGVAFYTAQKTASIEEGISLAAEIIESGLAMKKLEEMRKK